jgi:hypothetical protein
LAVIALLFVFGSCSKESGSLTLSMNADAIDQASVEYFVFLIESPSTGQTVLFPDCLGQITNPGDCVKTPANCSNQLPATDSQFELELAFLDSGGGARFPKDSPVDITACAVKGDLTPVGSGSVANVPNSAGESADIVLTASDSSCANTVLAFPKCP